MVCLVSFLAPVFDGLNYFIWSHKMEVYLSYVGFDVWMSIINGCPSKVSPPTDSDAERRNQCHEVAIKAILYGLIDDVSYQVDKCRFSKSLCDRFKKLYGNEPTTVELACDDMMRNTSHII